eukprot:CAMPEP_0175884476 /NCGR_PEP_ID=MMETSP0107_2-20121207/44544_1 /TAXON_ID=195067 ORGANISM="Goniomonas pacifica, Strain CCMP1869" /NCGR_SAMPLE_ID=MMETSP0107_2 /ASSEMBLY_ACC=CAM_ASM_000203 /LENGTH=109 /DNA_ID=CAMNT_0017204635 /DNA_START=54 /DNA_END=384 /DNA_ORIENTATION=+
MSASYHDVTRQLSEAQQEAGQAKQRVAQLQPYEGIAGQLQVEVAQLRPLVGERDRLAAEVQQLEARLKKGVAGETIGREATMDGRRQWTGGEDVDRRRGRIQLIHFYRE